MNKILSKPDLCDGCKDCEEACARLYGAPRIIIREINDVYYPIICQYCEDAPCKTICPTEAITEGVDPEKCIGCGLCMVVCPFGAILMADRKAHKCNQCLDRNIPACIKACSKRALVLVDAEELKRKKQEEYIERVAGLARKPEAPGILHLIETRTRANQKLGEGD